MGDLPKPDNDVLSETLWANPSGSAPIGVKGRSANGAQPGKYPNMQPASSAYGPWGGAPIILPPVDAREERKMQNSSDSNPLASMALYRNHRESNPALAKSLSEINGRMNSGDSSISSGDPRKIKLENR